MPYCISLYNSVGTITNLNVTGGTADFTGSQNTRTVTTAKVGKTGQIKYDISILTLTNKIQPVETSGTIAFTAS